MLPWQAAGLPPTSRLVRALLVGGPVRTNGWVKSTECPLLPAGKVFILDVHRCRLLPGPLGLLVGLDNFLSSSPNVRDGDDHLHPTR